MTIDKTIWEINFTSKIDNTSNTMTVAGSDEADARRVFKVYAKFAYPDGYTLDSITDTGNPIE